MNFANSTEQPGREAWQRASRRLATKAISEFAHELLLAPHWVASDGLWDIYRLGTADVRYEFRAQRLELDDWLIDESSLRCWRGLEAAEVDACRFLMDFEGALGVSKLRLPDYLDGLARTTFGLARRIEQCLVDKRTAADAIGAPLPKRRAEELVRGSFQEVEAAMYEGHPVFVANADRRGFSRSEHEQFAPELGPRFALHWLAVDKACCRVGVITGEDYASFLRGELEPEEFELLVARLVQRGYAPDLYHLVPVHPWQWRNRVAQLYAADVAQGKIVYLGEGLQLYQPQQSIRTLLSTAARPRHYVKTALGVVNMGFARCLSPALAERGAAVNLWIGSLLSEDRELHDCGFKLLREVAFVGVSHRYYEQSSTKRVDAYREGLAALWRESPGPQLRPDQRVVTMAAMLHVDEWGSSQLAALIEASGANVGDWVRAYLKAYLRPLVHCLYAHHLVFTPHAENVLLIVENHLPVGIFIKDLAEDIGIINPSKPVPESVKHIALRVPDDWVTLCVFTDSFDGVFRFVARLLWQHLGYKPAVFWKCVAEEIADYLQRHPETSDEQRRWDLFAPSFARNCLNRLQLTNPDEMVDLNAPDPAASLQFRGTLSNPIAPSESKVSP